MNNNTIVGTIVILLLLVAVGAFLFGGGQKEIVAGEYDTFAQCLTGAGMKMYGSVTCRFCAEQRAMFGASFKLIREIECDPRNPLAQTELCVEKNITATPTWIREDTEGNEIFRFGPGVETLEVLSEKSECLLQKDMGVGVESSATKS